MRSSCLGYPSFGGTDTHSHPTEATCDHCGKTAPCRLDYAFDAGGVGWGKRNFHTGGGAIRGLGTWFWKADGVACSEECKEALAKKPRHADFGGQWRSRPYLAYASQEIEYRAGAFDVLQVVNPSYALRIAGLALATESPRQWRDIGARIRAPGNLPEVPLLALGLVCHHTEEAKCSRLRQRF